MNNNNLKTEAVKINGKQNQKQTKNYLNSNFINSNCLAANFAYD